MSKPNIWDCYGLQTLTSKLNWIKSTNPKVYNFYKDGKWQMRGSNEKDIEKYKQEGYTVEEADNKKLIKDLEKDIKHVKEMIEEGQTKYRADQLAKIVTLKKPTQCYFWKKEKLEDTDFSNAFDYIKVFHDESHFGRKLLKCKECGQLYLMEFYEEIDWINGNDAQYFTYFPVRDEEEASILNNANLWDIQKFIPRLNNSWPTDKPRKIYWVGNDFASTNHKIKMKHLGKMAK